MGPGQTDQPHRAPLRHQDHRLPGGCDRRGERIGDRPGKGREPSRGRGASVENQHVAQLEGLKQLIIVQRGLVVQHQLRRVRTAGGRIGVVADPGMPRGQVRVAKVAERLSWRAGASRQPRLVPSREESGQGGDQAGGERKRRQQDPEGLQDPAEPGSRRFLRIQAPGRQPAPEPHFGVPTVRLERPRRPALRARVGRPAAAPSSSMEARSSRANLSESASAS